jgi:ribosomal protein L24
VSPTCRCNPPPPTHHHHCKGATRQQPSVGCQSPRHTPAPAPNPSAAAALLPPLLRLSSAQQTAQGDHAHVQDARCLAHRARRQGAGAWCLPPPAVLRGGPRCVCCVPGLPSAVSTANITCMTHHATAPHTLQVMVGKDKGKQGEVLRVVRDQRFPRVFVQGINMVSARGAQLHARAGSLRWRRHSCCIASCRLRSTHVGRRSTRQPSTTPPRTQPGTLCASVRAPHGCMCMRCRSRGTYPRQSTGGRTASARALASLCAWRCVSRVPALATALD